MRSPSPTSTPPTSLPLRILTHNIRFATQSPSPGELPWSDRKAGLIAELVYHTRPSPTSLICLQEVLHAQLVDILAGLNAAAAAAAVGTSRSPDDGDDDDDGGPWSYVGVGRDDGAEAGEYSPILYRADVWLLGPWFTRWLSPTPRVPGSKGWDAASVRIVTVATFSLMTAGLGIGPAVLALNTHLDDQGSVSRRESAKLIVRILSETLEQGAAAAAVDGAFLTGDLNSETTGDAYRVLNGEGSGLVDMERLVERGGMATKYGDEMTFTGFDGHGAGNDQGRATKIDFIHLSTELLPEYGCGAQANPPRGSGSSEQAHWQVHGYAVLPNRFENGIYISDHRAVVGDVMLPVKG